MSVYISNAMGSSQPSNPNITYEPLGFGASGAMTSLTSGGSNNTKGSYGSIGTTSSAWCGFWLNTGIANIATARYLLDIRVGSSTIILPDYYIHAGTTAAINCFVPLKVAANTLIEARIQSQTASNTLRVALNGILASSTLPPGFDAATALNVDTSATTPSTTNVPASSSVSWTQLVASTAATYGAIMSASDTTTTAWTTAQDYTIILATGASSSEVEFFRYDAHTQAGTGLCQRSEGLAQKSIASGTRISAACLAATPNSDNARVAIYGLA